MKTLVVTTEQLNTYINNKKAERVFYDIVADLHENRKYLKESVSLSKADQSIIDNYRRKKLVSPLVEGLLIKHGVLNENREII